MSHSKWSFCTFKSSCMSYVEVYFKFYMVSIFFHLMQELLYLYGFVIDDNTDDYLMVMAAPWVKFVF